MKRFFLLFILVVFSLTFSACAKKDISKKKEVLGDGGVYKSSDGGETFFPINKISEEKNLSGESVLDIVINPQNPKVVYVGTKENGIFRSENGGETWAESRSDFSYVKRIALDPQDENVLYIVAESQGEMALFKTTDGGINWQRLLLPRDDNQPMVLDVYVDRQNPQIVYATDSTNGIYKSTNGGLEWKAVYWGNFPAVAILLDKFDDNIAYFITTGQEIYITNDGGKNFYTARTDGPIYSANASATEKGVFYVLYQGGLFVSRDAGHSFQLLPTLLKPQETVANIVVTDPIDKNIIYLVAGKVIYKTEDGGETWRAIPLKVKWRVSQFEINPKNNSEIYLGLQKPIRRKMQIPFIR